MIPFVSSLVEAVSAYFQMTVADPCHSLNDQRAESRRRKPKKRSRAASARAAATAQSRRSFFAELLGPRNETLSPDVYYSPLRANESLTEHYMAAVYYDEFGGAHPRDNAPTTAPYAAPSTNALPH